MDRKEAVAKLVKIYTEAQSLSDQEKDLKAEIKESGLNPTIVSAVAKSIVNAKVSDLKQKSEETIKLLDEVL